MVRQCPSCHRNEDAAQLLCCSHCANPNESRSPLCVLYSSLYNAGNEVYAVEESISVKYSFKDPHMHLSGKYCVGLEHAQHRPWIPDRAARVLGPSQEPGF